MIFTLRPPAVMTFCVMAAQSGTMETSARLSHPTPSRSTSMYPVPSRLLGVKSVPVTNPQQKFAVFFGNKVQEATPLKISIQHSASSA